MLEGLPPNQATHLMRLRADEVTARRVADLVVESFDPAEVAGSAFEETASASDAGPWIVEVYFQDAPDEAAVRGLVAVAGDAALAESAVFDRVSAQDWVAAGLAGLPSLRVGRFVLHGAHARGAVRANDIGIEIEAALAFGTGHHGTTRGCLALLNGVARRRRPASVLDVGTGSGILAIAAARLFHVPVRAGDIDAVAIAAARGNVRRNRAGDVRLVRSAGLAHPMLRQDAPYDLVFANILAGPLRRLAPSIAGALGAGGELILSGLLPRDVAGVLSAYRAQGLAMTAKLEVEGWAALLLRRP
jgi:ribosomal protein L11 methyltransferase